MRILVTIASVIFIFGCKTYGDYNINVKNVQNISSEGISEIVIECFCSDSIVIETSSEDYVEVKSIWELSSVGYHGMQIVPNDEPSETTMLVPERSGKVLKLKSTEYTYMHHANVITSLIVALPKGIKVEISKIQYGDLEGRNVKA